MLLDLSHVKSGFSDKLRAITFFVAFAKQAKLKFFFNIYEKKNFQCPFKFVDYCKIDNFKFKKIESIYDSIKDNNIIINSYNSELNIANCIKHNYSDKVKNSELLKQWKLSYKSIIPNVVLHKKIKKLNLPRTLVGIHIRSTDRLINFKKIIYNVQLKDTFFNFQLKSFEKNLSNLIKKNTNIKNIYVASDQKELKNKIIKNLFKDGFKIYYNKSFFKKKKFRKTSGEDFLIDLFSLSVCNIIITTVGGGVPYTAKLLSHKKIKIIKWIDQVNIFIFIRLLVLVIYYLKRLKSKILDFLRILIFK